VRVVKRSKDKITANEQDEGEKNSLIVHGAVRFQPGRRTRRSKAMAWR
jgi:hypothetical protein